MIEYITGKIAEKHPTYIIIETGGIGYKVNIPLSTHNKTGKIGDSVKLIITPYIREDSWTLYGFATEEERGLFNLLLSVSGVGPKSAVAALSSISPYQLRSALASNDADRLTLIPGIGKKTAQRIGLELKDKIQTIPGEKLEILPLDAAYEEALLALEALGYNRIQAEKAIEKVRKSGNEEKAEVIIRKALAVLTGR